MAYKDELRYRLQQKVGGGETEEDKDASLRKRLDSYKSKTASYQNTLKKDEDTASAVKKPVPASPATQKNKVIRDTSKRGTTNSKRVQLGTLEERKGKQAVRQDRVMDAIKGTGKSLAGSYGSAIGTTMQSVNPLELTKSLTKPGGIGNLVRDTVMGDIRNDGDSYSDAVFKNAGRQLTKKSDELIQSGSKDIDKAKDGLGKVGQFAVDVGTQGLMMGSDALLNVIAPGAGMMGFYGRAAGASASEARREGADEDQQLLYGAASGLMELGLERLFSAGKYLKGMYGKGALDIATPMASRVATSNLVKGIVKSPQGQELVYQLAKAGFAMNEEGIEEALADLISPLLKRAVYADEIDMPSMGEVMYDYLVGAASGGLFGAAGTVADYKSGVGRMNQMQENGTMAEDMINRAAVQGEKTSAGQFAQQLSAQRESGKEVLGGQLNDLQRMTAPEQLKHETELMRQKEEADRKRMAGDVSKFNRTGTERENRAIVEISSGFVKDKVSDVEKIVAENADLSVTLSGDSATFEAVAKVATGTATAEDIDRILMKPAAKALVKEYTGVSLPVENTAARKSLENLVVFTGAEHRTEILTKAKARVAEDMASSLGAKGSAKFTEMYPNVNEQDNEKFYTVFKRFYNAGEYSMPIETVSKLVDDMGGEYQEVVDRYFTPEMRTAIHKAGFADSKVETTKNEERVIRHENIDQRAKKGAFEDHSTPGKLTKPMKRALTSLAKRTGVNIVFVDTLGESNGIYDNGTIYLAADAYNPIITVAKHELTHYLKQYAPNEYQELEDFVFTELNGKKNIEKKIEQKIRQYAEKGHHLTRSAAKEEILADMAEAFFTDESAIDRVIAYSKELGEAILDGIRTILDTFLVIAEEDKNKKNREYGKILDEIGILRDAERLWMKALQASLKNDVVGKNGKVMDSLKDSEDRDLSPAQQKYFAKSKVRDAQGRLKVMYHGSGSAGFTVFDGEKADDGRSFFFSDSLDVASGYSATNRMFKPVDFETPEELQEYILDELGEEVEIRNDGDRYALYQDGEFVVRDDDLYSLYWSYSDEIVGWGGESANYEVYLNLENPLIIDADNNNWDEIPVDWTEELLTTRAIAEYAGENGYDGVMINNVIDTGLYGKRFDVSNIAIAFSSEQIKSVANTEPTNNPDIRFSLKDSDGNELTKQQAEFFEDSVVRDADGNLLVLYHGSRSMAFTEFDLWEGAWLTPVQSYAEIYAEQWHSWRDDYEDTATERDDINGLEPEIYNDPDYRIYKMYANIEKPLDLGEIDGPFSEGFVRNIAKKMGVRFSEVNELAKHYYEEYTYMFTRSSEFIEFAKEHGYDGFTATESGKQTFCVFDAPNQVKLTTNQNPTENPDIRFSIKDEVTTTESGTVAKHSLKSWNDTDKAKLLKALTKAGYSKEDAEKWMDDVNSIAAIIAADRDRLDYTPDEHQKMLKDNNEYYKTLDASTLCKKRLLYQGTYNAIQHRLPNTPLHPEDVIRIRQIMDEAGLEVPCGICYEESRKKHEGTFAERWLNEYQGDYVPRLDQVTTTDGRAWLRRNHPEVLESYLKYQRTRGSANPKVSMTRTDYRGDILKLTATTIEKIKHIGGLRIQSFSDFETPHLIDMMQAIIDMSAKKLTSQAYTKVPAFARVFGGTGVKINLSLIGQVDKTGKLVFDDKEGMPHEEAFEIREMYPDNVGTILVGANEESILAAWADDRIDMVIPFHRSGWSFDEMEKLGLSGYDDFTAYQTEKYLDDERGPISFKEYKDVYGETMEELYSDDYWDFSKTGKENAEAYLKLCAEQKRVPVFSNFLVDNGDGSWSLQPDGSTDGYWKSLIDFKMYDNNGVGVPQKLVQPNFNMEEARKILDEYDEDADGLPVADDIVEQFVAEYKAAHPRAKYQLKEGPSYDRRVKTLEERVAYLKSEMKKTGLKTPVEKDTKVQASKLLKKYDSNMVLHTKLVDTMKDIFKIYKTADGDWNEAYDKAEKMARRIVDKIAILHDENWQEYKELREHLKKAPIAISDADKQIMGHYGDFYKANRGRMKLVNGEKSTVSDFYSKLVEKWPEKFTDDYTNPTDQLNHIEDVLDSLAPWYEHYSSRQMQALVTEIAEDIMVTTGELATRKTFADRKAEEKERAVDRVKRQRDAAMERLKEKYEEKLIRQKKVSREKMDAYKEKQKDRASRKKAMERLQKNTDWLADRLLNPTDDKHIPAGYEKAVADLLSAFDFSSVRSDEWTKKYGPSKRTMRFIYLKNAYAEILKQEDSPMEADEDILDLMQELVDELEDKRFEEIETEHLVKVSKMLKHIRHQISSVNRAFSEELRQNIAEMGEAVIRESLAKGPAKVAQNEKVETMLNFLNESNVKPADAFEEIGGTMNELYKAIRSGWDKKIVNDNNTKNFFEGVLSNSENAGEWVNEVHSFELNGKTVEMTTTQLMSLYCLSKREQALQHIIGSGIVIAPQTIKRTKWKKDQKAKEQTDNARRRLKKTHTTVTYEELQKMLAKLTDEQKDVADRIQNYLSSDLSELGNEVSLKLYGYKKFTEKNYFPIKSSEDWLATDFSGKDKLTRTIQSSSMTKKVNKNANNAIVIDDFFTTVTNHAVAMNLYNAMVLPLSDFRRVYNYTRGSENGTDPLKKYLADAYGDRINRYIDNFLNNVNTSYADNRDLKVLESLMSNYKKASLGWNLRVLVQQPTSVARAFAVLNPKYLSKVGKVKASTYEEMRNHCPIALWKSWGFYNSDIGPEMKNVLLGQESKLDKLTMGIYGKADDVTWACIWEMVKAEVGDTHPELKKGSDEYWQKVNERASYVYDRTQVVDSVFHRSQIMRDKSLATKMITSFMAEPTTTYNMMRTEVFVKAKSELKAGNKMKAFKIVSRVSGVYVASAMLTGSVAALIDALRGAGDDEEEEKWKDRWLSNTFKNFISNANPIGLIPIGSEIASVIQGFDPSRMDMEAIEKLSSAIRMWGKVLNGDSDYTMVHVTRKFAEAVAYLTGLPLANALRDVEGVARTTADAVGEGLFADYIYAQLVYHPVNKKNEYIKIYYNALHEGDRALAAEIKKFLLSKGVSKDDIDKYKSTWKQSMVKKYVAEINAGKITIAEVPKDYRESTQKKLKEHNTK